MYAVRVAPSPIEGKGVFVEEHRDRIERLEEACG